MLANANNMQYIITPFACLGLILYVVICIHKLTKS